MDLSTIQEQKLYRNLEKQSCCGDKYKAPVCYWICSTYCAVLGALLLDNLLVVAFRQPCNNIYPRPVNMYTINTDDWMGLFIFHFGKGVTLFVFYCFLPSHLVACVAIFVETRVQDDRCCKHTHRALTFKQVQTNLKKIIAF